MQPLKSRLQLLGKLNSDHRRCFSQLDRLAQSGDFDAGILDQLKYQPVVEDHKSLVYYLASLYLQLGQTDVAMDMLSSCGRATREMNLYCCVLIFSLKNNLPLPVLSPARRNCLEYLDSTLNPVEPTIADKIISSGGFSIVGNAPDKKIVYPPKTSCKFFFNSYQQNTRITDVASIHVVTPSWKLKTQSKSDILCISGNSIFNRRSRVWQKFMHDQRYSAIYTLPRALWARLSKELKCSPSAGILMLAYIAEALTNDPCVGSGDAAGLKAAKPIIGYVAGFSNGKPQLNHDYDSVPASDRHNWNGEAAVYQRLISSLQRICNELTVQA